MADPGSAIAADRRRAAALAGHRGETSVARTLLADDDGSVRATAYAALARCGALDGETLNRGLRDPDSEVRRRCATLAAASDDRAAVTEALLERLADDDHLVAEAAAWAFGEWGADGLVERALSYLITMTLSHSEPLCREAAVAALGAIGDERGLEAILHACTDKPAIRRRAVLALAPFEGDRVEKAIDSALKDRDWQVRQAAEDLHR